MSIQQGNKKEADALIESLESGAGLAVEPADLAIKKEKEAIKNELPPETKVSPVPRDEPKRPELVCKEDILKVLEMDKIDIQKYCSSRLDKNVDMSRRLKQLRLDAVTMIKGKLNLPTDTNSSLVDKKDAPKDAKPEFVFNPKNRRIFEWTPMLSKKIDLIEVWLVDKDDNRV
jgi:hypothetical protein